MKASNRLLYKEKIEKKESVILLLKSKKRITLRQRN